MDCTELAQQAELALGQGNYRCAIALYEQCIEAEPSTRSHHWHLGLALLLQGQIEEAHEVWVSAQMLDTSDAGMDGAEDLINTLKTAIHQFVRLDNWQPVAVICRQLLELDATDLAVHRTLGLSLAYQGQVEAAIAVLQTVLKQQPNDPETLKNLGIASAQGGDLETAVHYFQRALAINFNDADIHRHWGIALENQGDLSGAIARYQQALSLDPTLPATHNNLGNICKAQGDIPRAIEWYQQALQLDPSFYKARYNLGLILEEQGQTETAIDCYQKVVVLKPNLAIAHLSLGVARLTQGNVLEASNALRSSLELEPNSYKALFHLGRVLEAQGDVLAAIAHYQQVVALQPDFAPAYNNLGMLLSNQYQLTEAAATLQTALDLKPDFAEAYNNLGLVRQKQGLLKEAAQCFHQASDLAPDLKIAHSNLLFSLLYDADSTPEFVLSEALRWASGPSVITYSAYKNAADPQRRLRVGYVSPDFRSHSVAYFIEPILAHHDRSQFEVFAYAQVPLPDAVTQRLQKLPEHWRSIVGLSDQAVVELIRSDGIDILVDLAGHTGNHRLAVFEYKPAPIQITYLGYPSTTGLAQMDYRLTDDWADPASEGDRGYTEELIRLPQGFLCYQPAKDAPEVSALPALQKGYVTLGSFNNLAKITPAVVACWVAILKVVPTAQLLLKNHSFRDDQTQKHYLQAFVAQGIEPQRVQFVGYVEPHEHLGFYNQIDLGLDTFPYNGTTTTCEALWMGVPIVVLAGQNHAGRVGVSLLSSLGLRDLVAENPENYVAKVAKLAHDLGQFSEMRTSLRQRMASSTLCNAPQFVGELEGVYRQVWQRWCSNPSRSTI
jgi:protein O-GlcNAc transferase